AAGVKADFTNLTGDDIRALASTRIAFQVHDVYAAKDTTVSFTTGKIAFYGELKTHWPAANLGTTRDLFHVADAKGYCSAVVRNTPYTDDNVYGKEVSETVDEGKATGGATVNDSIMATIHMGNIGDAIRSGGDTNPEIFVAGSGQGSVTIKRNDVFSELKRDDVTSAPVYGVKLPTALVFVNGSRSASAAWSIVRNGINYTTAAPPLYPNDRIVIMASIGTKLHEATSWNLSDAYFVNNWPGAPYTLHKGNGDSAYHYVTQVNYITGYICAASLH
ncbi:hypothetical protein MRR01_003519, partial [Salmonella enterica]|nr:hypothetical protein [Salmonella enterica]